MKPNKIDTAYIRFQEWERVAKDDEEMIRIGLKEKSSPNPLCFHAQQMAEKFLKGFLAYHKQPPTKIHQLDQQFTFEEAKQAYARASEIALFVRSKLVLPHSSRASSHPALSAMLFLAVLAASFALAPGVVRGEESEATEKERTDASEQPVTQIRQIQRGRFGLNAVAELLGLTKCVNNDVTLCPAPDIREVLLKLIQIALGFTSLLVLIFVLYGGFTWTTAAGNAERVDKGRKILIWAGAGLVAVLLAWSVVTYVLYTASRVVG